MTHPNLLSVADVDVDLAWQRRGGLEWLGPEDWAVIDVDARRGRLHLDAIPGSLMVSCHAGSPTLGALELDQGEAVAWRGALPNGLGNAVVFDAGSWRMAIVARGALDHTRIGVFCAEREAFEARGGVMMLATVMTSMHRLPA